MDVAKLDFEMKKRNVSVTELCLAIGITKSTFYKKRRGDSEFTLGEIQRIVDYLELESPMGIFFPKKVS